MISFLARSRVPLGFAAAALAFVFAQPTAGSIGAGMLIALAGESVRFWAAGHIDKGREVTRSGPYRFVRHPLYLGSALLGAGFIVAGRSLAAAAVVAIYLSATLPAAIRAEEAALHARFGGEYAAYRDGRAAPLERRFSFARVIANREYRAIAGLAAALVLLYARSLI